MQWESSMWDWSKKGESSSVVTPEQVLKLVESTDKERADKAYWDLDGAVCFNGLAYGVSLNTVKLILSMLPSCSIIAKVRCLELLGQISSCKSDISSPSIVEECLEELKLSSWCFLYGLQYDVLENTWLYVDLVGVLGCTFDDFKPKAKSYLEKTLQKRGLSNNDIEMIRNTLAEL